jgi:UDP-N-acetyl-D-mannosaminuronic acid dehydrogenase/UDP-N-acetyl-D-glucosamine dehydrogenase
LLNRYGRPVRDTRILLLGVTYKAGTSDCRESPSLVVAERLAALGADLRACDPHVPAMVRPSLGFELVDYTPAELEGADLAVVLVDHPEFQPADIAAHARLVFDTKALLRGYPFEGELL